MRDALLPLLAIAAGLLLAAGISKLRAPEGTRAALRAFGLPARAGFARAVGAVEICVGAAALTLPGAASAAALALIYLVLAVAVAVAWRRGEPDVPCGCLGESDAPAGLGHLCVNLACLGVAASAVARPPHGLAETLANRPSAAAAALLAGVACAVYLLFALLSLLPESWRAYRETRGDAAL